MKEAKCKISDQYLENYTSKIKEDGDMGCEHHHIYIHIHVCYTLVLQTCLKFTIG